MRLDRLGRWQIATTVTLLVGYAGYYVCRSNLSIVAPELVAEFGGEGLDRSGLGLIISAGILAYAVGKVVTGIWGDFLGGRVAFVGGMALSALATVAFSVSSALPVFLGIWVVNRFVQSIGWGALVKVAAHWFAPSRYGTVMGILSLSFLFGDAIGRFLLGGLLQGSMGWRGVFLSAAGALGLIAVVTWLMLRDSPADVGLPEPPVSAANVFGADGAASAPTGIADLLTPFFLSPTFWAICVVSVGLTLIRETFNAWTPTYLVDVYGLSQADAAQKSSLFPFIGGLSVLVVGTVSDRVSASARLAITVPMLALAVVALSVIGSPQVAASETAGMILLGSVAFFVIGPYSLLAGAMAVDLGGRRGSATAAGLIDSAGYLGAVLSGWGIGTLAERVGWEMAFRALAAAAAGAVAATLVYCMLRWRSDRPPNVAVTIGRAR